jgi:hypothetical protein
LAATDLHSDGFGTPWGQTRSWSNGPGYATGGDNGNGWVDTYTPPPAPGRFARNVVDLRRLVEGLTARGICVEFLKE